MVEAAQRDLAERQVLIREDFDRLAEASRRSAFTVARVQSLDALERIRVALVADVNEGGTLREFRDQVEQVLGEVAVLRLEFLQADDVGIELLHRMADVVDLQAPRRPQALHAFVDVPGGHPQRGVFVALGHHAPSWAKRGSIRIASALDGEKQVSAACCQCSHCHSVCSLGLRVTGVPSGTKRPNTRSVLRLTSGA